MQTQDFPMICALAVTRMLTAPLNLSKASEGCYFTLNFNYNTLQVPTSYTNLPCLPSYWVMFELTHSFGLKKIYALKGWRLVISCLHKSLSFVQLSTQEWFRRYNMLSVEKRYSSKKCSSHIFIFVGVQRKPSTTCKSPVCSWGNFNESIL